MGTLRPTETTGPSPMARRLLLAGALLALALALGIAGATSALAAPAHPAHTANPAQPAHPTAKAVADEPPASGGVSPAVPLVLAGIVILAASGPWLPPRSGYVHYRVERRW